MKPRPLSPPFFPLVQRVYKKCTRLMLQEVLGVGGTATEPRNHPEPSGIIRWWRRTRKPSGLASFQASGNRTAPGRCSFRLFRAPLPLALPDGSGGSSSVGESPGIGGHGRCRRTLPPPLPARLTEAGGGSPPPATPTTQRCCSRLASPPCSCSRQCARHAGHVQNHSLQSGQ